MPIVGITGGIATGKSSFASALLSRIPAAGFDADRSARELVERDPGVAADLRQAFPDTVFRPDGTLDRAALRELVFHDAGLRRTLEGILHPRIREEWTSQAAEARRQNAWLIVDIPLLFETGTESEFDHVVVSACSSLTQRKRLQFERKLSGQLIENILGSQWPLERKIGLAGHVVWTEGSREILAAQAGHLARYLLSCYG